MVLLLPSIRPSTLDRYGVDARLLYLTILTFSEILWMLVFELLWNYNSGCLCLFLVSVSPYQVNSYLT